MALNEQQVLDLMRTSNSKEDWNKNCVRVKAACGGYPEFWYPAIILSGVMAEVSLRWGGTDQIEIIALPHQTS